MKPDILSLSLDEIRNLVEELGEPKFRADQLYRWLHVSKATSFEEMTNLPAKLKEKLAERYIVDPRYTRSRYLSRAGLRGTYDLRICHAQRGKLLFCETGPV